MASKRTSYTLGIITVLSAFGLLGSQSVFAEVGNKDMQALTQALGKSKQTLLMAMRQAAEGNAAVISAKFEMEDGKLSLSVYTAKKGLDVPPEDNILQELSGSPEQDRWSPTVEVFKDIPHVSRAAEHLVLTSLAHKNLVDLVVVVQKSEVGTVFSVTPTILNHKAVVVVLFAEKDKVKKLILPL